MGFSRSSYIITSEKVLSLEEQKRLMALCRRTVLAGQLRDPLLIMLAFECGMRASEVRGLLIRDFNEQAKTIFIRSLKGSREREIPLKVSTSRVLKRFILEANRALSLNQVDPNTLIFSISYPRLNQIWQEYRPSPRKTFHCLRHSFAVNLYQRTQSIKVVQMALGHKSILNTMVYVDFSYSNIALRRYMHGRPTSPGNRNEAALLEGPELVLFG